MKWFSDVYAKLIKAFQSIPPFLRVGVVVFVVSGALDLAYHGISAFWPDRLDAYLGPDGYYTHLALFIGMVLIVVGIIGTQPERRTIEDKHEDPEEIEAEMSSFIRRWLLSETNLKQEQAKKSNHEIL